jgi:uncharacterized protein (TIGR00303 family)
MFDSGFVQVVNDRLRMESLFTEMSSSRAFYLCLGGTKTSDLVGISAAGATPELRRVTPAADAEALLLGYTKTVEKLPVSPRGIVSPVVITRACLQLADIEPLVINCGAFKAPQIPFFEAGLTPAESVVSGQAMTLDMVIGLFRRGFDFGVKEAAGKQTLVIAECVPGGTTTALAVLVGLGYEAHNSMSSSIPNCNHEDRWNVVEQGLKVAGIVPAHSNPFEILAAVGDPMQPFVVGMTLAACQSASVILAGGSQMLAVYALCQALSSEYAVKITRARIGVLTTKWVAFDRNAGLVKMSAEIGAPFAASCPNFLLSRHIGLRAYEQGNVKEGVGAGAALALAYFAAGQNSSLLMNKIDQTYDSMVGRFCPAPQEA